MSCERALVLAAAALAALAACAPGGGARELGAAVDLVEPPCGDPATPTSVVLRGSFPVVPRVSLSGGGAELDTTYRAWVGDVALRDVTWRDAGSLAATVPASIPAGVYALTVESPFHDRATLPGFEIRAGGCGGGAPGALTLSASVAPNAVTVGQQVTVTASVRNAGAQALFDVDAAVSSAPAGVALVASQAGPRDLAGGATATFTWTYATSQLVPEPGGTFVVTAAGTDGGGAAVVAPPARTNAFLVNAPASIAAHTHSPASVNVGRAFTLSLDAANTGAAPALVAAAVTATVTGAATVATLSSPVPETVPGGTERSLAWSFSANGPCQVALTVGVTATDLSTGQALAVAPTLPATVQVQRPAALSTVVSAPATVAAGGTVTVTASVQNTGQATASDVTATLAAAPPLFTLLSGPGAPQPIAGGAAASLAWSFRAEPGATHGTFSVDAAALDANDLTTVTAARAVSGDVAAAYPIGGSVSGLANGTVGLRNGTEDLSVTGDGAFTFPTRVASGATYAVSVAVQPVGRTCAVANGAGTVVAAPVTGVAVTCTRQTRTLSTLVVPEGAGTLSCNGAACQPAYPYGTVVELTHAAGTGWAFSSWSGDCSGSGTCAVTLDANRSVTATFTALTFALATAASPPAGGTVTCDGGACLATYPYGTVVQLAASPAAGYAFGGWSGDCTGTGTCAVTMTASRAVTASFTGLTYALATAVVPDGAGTLSCNGAPCQPEYPYGTDVQLRAAASAGYEFVEWSGDCAGTHGCSVTMTASRAVTATFGALPAAP